LALEDDGKMLLFDSLQLLLNKLGLSLQVECRRPVLLLLFAQLTNVVLIRDL
jgi:hypothetical protein